MKMSLRIALAAFVLAGFAPLASASDPTGTIPLPRTVA